MNKYDYGYEIHPNTTTSFAFDQVTKGAKVLELGSSNGNLTKHLAEEKNCQVDIVEIDQQAGEQAAQFARRGLTGPVDGDLEREEWLKALGRNRYDFVIILDVLEHLRRPEAVLLKVKKLLKKDGAIILSVPNMAHNSVLIDMIRNRIHYTNLGILDNTHLHFFAQGTLDEMVRSCGLCAVQKKAIQIPVGSNEIQNTYEDLGPEWAALLKARPLAEVFQFIYVLKTQGPEAELEPEPLDTTKRLVKLYYKKSEADFFSEDCIRYAYLAPQEKSVRFDLTDTGAAVVRIDPLYDRCILDDIHLVLAGADGEEQEPEYEANGEKIKNGCYCFNTPEPQLTAVVPEGMDLSQVRFSFEPVLVGERQLAAVESYVREWKGYLDYLERETGKAREKARQASEDSERLGTESEQRRVEIERLNAESEQRRVEIERLNAESEQRRTEIERLGAESEQRRMEIERLQAENERLNAEKNGTEERLDSLLKLAEEGLEGYPFKEASVQDRLNELFHSRMWRIVCPLKKMITRR